MTPEHARRPGRRPGRPGRPAGRRPGRPVLDVRLPARRPHPGGVQPRAVPADAGGGGRPGAGGPPGERGRPGDGRGRARRRHRRPGRDDPGPDRRAPPGRPGPRRPRRPGPAVHPLQPGLPGPRQPQPAGQLRGRAPAAATRRSTPTPWPHRPAPDRRAGDDVLVVGRRAGRARVRRGCSRVRGHRVRVVERTDRAGGALRPAAVGPGRRAAGRPGRSGWPPSAPGWAWSSRPDGEATPADLDAARRRGRDSGAGHRGPAGTARRSRPTAPCPVVDAAGAARRGPAPCPTGRWWSTTRSAARSASGWPSGWPGPGADVALVTPDQIAGTLLSLTGDLADANTRLQRAGVRRELRALLRGDRATAGSTSRTSWTGATRDVRLPRWWSTAATGCPRSPSTWSGPARLRAGDCVAPRDGARGRARGTATGPRDLRARSPARRDPAAGRSDPVTDTDEHRTADRARRVGWPARWRWSPGPPGARGAATPSAWPPRAPTSSPSTSAPRSPSRLPDGDRRTTSPRRRDWSRRPGAGW